MRFSWTRVAAIVRKEQRDYRRNRFVIVTMTLVPVAFTIAPMIQLFVANATGKSVGSHLGLSMVYMLVIPVTVPAVLAAYSVVGEREQGTLEPLLTTPIRREELLIGKALAAFVPAVLIAYAVFGIFLAVAALFAQPAVVSAIYAGTTCWSSCSSRRCSRAGRSGSGSRSPPGPPTCASPSSWARSPACRPWSCSC